MALPLLHRIAEVVLRRTLEWNRKCLAVMFTFHLGAPWVGTVFSGFSSLLKDLPVQDASNEHPLCAGLGNT